MTDPRIRHLQVRRDCTAEPTLVMAISRPCTGPSNLWTIEPHQCRLHRAEQSSATVVTSRNRSRTGFCNQPCAKGNKGFALGGPGAKEAQAYVLSIISMVEGYLGNTCGLHEQPETLFQKMWFCDCGHALTNGGCLRRNLEGAETG